MANKKAKKKKNLAKAKASSQANKNVAANKLDSAAQAAEAPVAETAPAKTRATKSSSSKASEAKASATKASATKAKRSSTNARAKAAPAKKKGLSPRAQWGLLIAVPVLIIGALIVREVIDAFDPGGTGVVAAESWDLPVLGDSEPAQRVRLADFDGTPTVVNFFASWCTECDTELPFFRDAALDLDGQVDFVFVNSNESGNWRGMVDRNGIGQLTLVQDIEGTRRNGLYRSLRGTGGMPMTAFYDAQGNLIDTVFSALDEAGLRARMASLGMI